MILEQAAPDRLRHSLGAAAIYRLRADRFDDLLACERARECRIASDGLDEGDADPMPRDGCEMAWIDLGGGG